MTSVVPTREAMTDIIELLNLPDEQYTELNIFMTMHDFVRVEAKFIAKGEVNEESI